MEKQSCAQNTVADLSFDAALQKLKEGNKLYIESKYNRGDISIGIRRHTALNGQHPYAVVVCCSDSRVIPESIFQAGIGDLFVIRVAGNVIGEHELGSIEYAVSHLGCKLVVVLGHNHCGAVGAAVSGHMHGFIKSLTDKIVVAANGETDEDIVCRRNVMFGVKTICEELKIGTENALAKTVGAVYRLEDGVVEFL